MARFLITLLGSSKQNWYDTVEADDKGSDLERKPFLKVYNLSDQ